MKDLCAAMGICWHKPSDPYCVTDAYGRVIGNEQKCLLCGSRDVHNPSPTDPAFCWRALQWLRSDWKRWDSFTFYAKEEWGPDEYSPKGIRRDFTEWLLDPARFIELADEWCREHPEKGE